MSIRALVLSSMILMPWTTWAVQSLYCPQNHGYINVGMSEDQVISACGQPISKQPSTKPITQKIPVQQITYNRQGAKKAFYGVWAMPLGYSQSGALEPPFGGNGGGGVTLQVDVINNKISSIKMNNSNSNAFSICSGTSIQIGDPVGKLYGACGTPSLVNSSYINQVIPTSSRPELWVYQPGEFQPAISLTFVDGKLQSID